MHASVNVGCQRKSGPGKIHEVILVQLKLSLWLKKISEQFHGSEEQTLVSLSF